MAGARRWRRRFLWVSVYASSEILIFFTQWLLIRYSQELHIAGINRETTEFQIFGSRSPSWSSSAPSSVGVDENLTYRLF